MNIISTILLLIVAAIGTFSCTKQGSTDKTKEETVPVELTMVDKDATEETKALYSNLWVIQERGFMFGHHDDLMYGRDWYNHPLKSDTKDVCGDYPAVYSLDFAEMVDDRYDDPVSMEANAIRKRCIVEAYDRGMVITACLHLNNPLTGGDAWDNSSVEVVKEILTEGSETNIRFNQWLDRLAEIAKNLKGSDGKTIPVILRPFHEHTQKWSWWGQTCTEADEFISLWRYFVTYLRDVKSVHNFVYAISPQMDSRKTENDFYFRWPGDSYVDFIGMDCYHGINNNVFINNLKVLSEISLKKKKPAGVTETGVEGFTATDYWTSNIADPMMGRRVALVVTWRNKFDPNHEGNHYFSVFPGHPSEKDFIKMYNRSYTFFCEDLPDMYTIAENVIIK